MRLRNLPLFYWDTCVFLAWLKDEPNDATVLAGMEETVKLVDNYRAVLMTSVVTRTEILESTLDATMLSNFHRIFSRRNVYMAVLDHKIADISHEIRNYYREKEGKNLSSTDCHHLATAIHYEAMEMNTMDGCGKKKKHCLLPLNGIVANKYPMKICLPFHIQPSLIQITKTV